FGFAMVHGRYMVTQVGCSAMDATTLYGVRRDQGQLRLWFTGIGLRIQIQL
ncbi:hypothetical protein A2U01_0107341, partial [Trifolium medium]|nr:hypothetical protein [Trifolium medium]